MARAYLRICVSPGTEKEVRDALEKLDFVQSADLTTGDQDVIAAVQGATYDEILTNIVNQVRGISGITDTSTSLVLD